MKRWLFSMATGAMLTGCNEQICSPAEWYEKRVAESDVESAAAEEQYRLAQGGGEVFARGGYCRVLCAASGTCKDPIPDGGTMEVPDSASGGVGGMSSNGGEGGAAVRVEKTYTVECYQEAACSSNPSWGIPGLAR